MQFAIPDDEAQEARRLLRVELLNDPILLLYRGEAVELDLQTSDLVTQLVFGSGNCCHELFSLIFRQQAGAA